MHPGNPVPVPDKNPGDIFDTEMYCVKAHGPGATVIVDDTMCDTIRCRWTAPCNPPNEDRTCNWVGTEYQPAADGAPCGDVGAGKRGIVNGRQINHDDAGVHEIGELTTFADQNADFGDYMVTNAANYVPFDSVGLMSTENFGSIGEVAWLGGTCRDRAKTTVNRDVGQSFSGVRIFAHEMGHK
ncbi:tRNA pseudouridine synthase A [Folsomia candida]|uniref:tRNA pseudouridine synthase A n=1 Tax=Folsomia candida TaxID=158441 RepID=A0A226D084_FOLCA|nr:tRNA pseudouridine synthase A [Folsomia candida]